MSQILGVGDEVAAGQFPLTPNAHKVIRHALGEARSLDREHVEPGHILLSLVDERESLAVRVLSDLGADLVELRRELIRRMEMA